MNASKRSPDGLRHVLFIVPTLRGGGAERVIVTLARNLDRRQFRVSLAVVDLRGAVYADDVPPDVELIDLKSSRVRTALPRILSLIWRRRPHIVFSTLGQINLALATFRALLPNDVRYVAREATVVSQLANIHTMPRWWFWLYRRVYARFDAIVCQSAEMRDDLVDNFNVPAAKTSIIYNPVDIARIRTLSEEGEASAPWPPGPKRVRLVAAGSLIPIKGFDLLLQALAKCPPSRFELTLLGEGPLRAELTALAARLGLSERVRFVGFQKNPYAYYRRADALVMSSRFEGFPNVVLEALACGTPVIAAPSPGGVREILNGISGCVLTKDCSPEALAEALMAFTPGQRIGPEVAERYAVERIVACYEQRVLGLSC